VFSFHCINAGETLKPIACAVERTPVRFQAVRAARVALPGAMMVSSDEDARSPAREPPRTLARAASHAAVGHLPRIKTVDTRPNARLARRPHRFFAGPTASSSSSYRQVRAS
jgi:hypothetical protein